MIWHYRGGSYLILLLFVLIPNLNPSILVPWVVEARILRVPEDYPTIEAAIIAATEGDTIDVAPGRYEAFTVDKAVVIRGAGAESTFINGTVSSSKYCYATIYINTSNSTITGFKIESSSRALPPSCSYGIDIEGDENKVFGCNIEAKHTGITILGRENSVSECAVASNEIGISIYGGGNNVTKCIIEAEEHGVKITHCWGNAVSECMIHSLKGDGVFIDPGRSTVFRNDIFLCTIEAENNGITGDDRGSVIGNIVRHNTIKFCRNGIWMRRNTYDSFILGNNFFNNSIQAIDDGSNNMWHKDDQGNFWSDWTIPDADKDGIVDRPYVVSGSAGSVDMFPLASPYAARGNLKITVRDENGNAISDVSISSTLHPSGQPSLAGFTSSDGSVTFQGILLGVYTLEASKSGYTTVTESGSVTAGKTSELIISLEKEKSGIDILSFPYNSIIIVIAVGVLILWMLQRKR